MSDSQNLVVRFRRWFVWALAFGVLVYVGATVWVGFDDMGEQLASFAWWIYVPVLLLTLVNYGLRFVKWHYLAGQVGAKLGWIEDAKIFLAGLAMVISPGKAGELLKPYLASKRTGVEMARTIPALIAERLTDGIAMLILAAISVSTYAGDRAHYIWIPAAITAAGLLVLASERLSMTILHALRRIGPIEKIALKLEVMYVAMRSCLAPVPFLATVGLSLVAWWAECLGFWLVFKGLGVETSLEACTFLYAFATVAGGAMPGGLGVADGALLGGAVTILKVSTGQAAAAALLVRVATLWFGVGLGALALLGFESMLEGGIQQDGQTPSTTTETDDTA